MPAELPIACSLSAAELPQRLAQIADLGHAALVGAHIDSTRAELRFVAGAEVRRRVEAIVAAESQCCDFLTLRVTDEPSAVVLTIDAPAGAECALEEFVAPFRGA